MLQLEGKDFKTTIHLFKKNGGKEEENRRDNGEFHQIIIIYKISQMEILVLENVIPEILYSCLLYTSDAADEDSSV